ncbi:GNAT family N-acetyltransferase [Marinifilum flexuosum]|uniref:GNAT family N-acetyltransferase n=1 Tax=Marinifilum flexuosum TaxID=1117708 RepID=UPI00249223A4|nr:GNAT family N-acetyltransferase [Marinifilum flexuosum]
MNFDLGVAYTRKPEVKDLEEIYKYRNDYQVYKTLGGFSNGMSRSNVRDWIEFHSNNKKDFVWVIADKETDLCIGHLGLYDIDFRIGKAEIGIAIAKEYWGKSIGSYAYKEVLTYAFNELRLNRVETFNLALNDKIIKIKQKLGFKVEGVLRNFQYRDGKYEDIMVMAILKNEYVGK